MCSSLSNNGWVVARVLTLAELSELTDWVTVHRWLARCLLAFSTGSSSPASLKSHGSSYSYGTHYLYPGQHVLPLPTPISAWEAKQQSVVTHSARSHAVSRPHLHTGNGSQGYGERYKYTWQWHCVYDGWLPVVLWENARRLGCGYLERHFISMPRSWNHYLDVSRKRFCMVDDSISATLSVSG